MARACPCPDAAVGQREEGVMVSLGRNSLLVRVGCGLYECPHCLVDLGRSCPDLSRSTFAWINDSFSVLTACSGGSGRLALFVCAGKRTEEEKKSRLCAACGGPFKLCFVEEKVVVQEQDEEDEDRRQEGEGGE